MNWFHSTFILIIQLFYRFLIEPGDENALLRHVVYITGLPKEIQNETLAEVFGGVCGQIAPVRRFCIRFYFLWLFFRWMYVHQNRKFGFIKIVKHVKAKEKQRLHSLVLNRVKQRLIISMVNTFILILRFVFNQKFYRKRIVWSWNSRYIMSKTYVQYAKTKYTIQSCCSTNEFKFSN